MKTLSETGVAGFRELARILSFDEATLRRAETAFRELATDWGDLLPNGIPPFPNDITDDGTPFEYSIAFGPDAELRALFEPQLLPHSPTSGWVATDRVLTRLEVRGAVHLEPFRALAPLFAAPGQVSPSPVWIAIMIRPGSPTLYKAYFHSLQDGTSKRWEGVEAALDRLGMASPRGFIHALAADNPNAFPVYFALDLVEGAEARAKVYVSGASSAPQAEKLVQDAPKWAYGDVTAWLRATLGEVDFPRERVPLVTYAFRPSRAIPELTVHAPIRTYSSSDEIACARVCALLPPPAARLFSEAVASVKRRPLAAKSGIVTYVSLRKGEAGERVTVYLAPELLGNAARPG